MTTELDEKSHVLRELHELERIADDGESSLTPLILIGEMWVACTIAVLALLGITLLAVRLAS